MLFIESLPATLRYGPTKLRVNLCHLMSFLILTLYDISLKSINEGCVSKSFS
jgi:hypothetical protein